MSAKAAARLLAGALTVPLGVAASLGLIDALRRLPGPSVALAAPLRETGHADRASIAVVAGVCAIVFGLSALALDSAPRRPLAAALVRSAGVLACALTLQAVSLQLVRQASLGLDWSSALASPAPYVCALGAFVGSAAAGRVGSSDRRMRPGPQQRPVDGRSDAPSLAKIGS